MKVGWETGKDDITHIRETGEIPSLSQCTYVRRSALQFSSLLFLMRLVGTYVSIVIVSMYSHSVSYS